MTYRIPHLKTLITGLSLLMVMGVVPAYAQQATTVAGVNQTIINQFATVPTLYKQITILAGVVSTMMGINGLYKGLNDPRGGPAPVKNGSLIVIGGMLLYMSYMALVAEKSFFGTNQTNNAQIRKSRTTTEMSPFR